MGSSSNKMSEGKERKTSSKAAFMRDLMRDVTGFAPYEKRCMELLKLNKDKRALKFCKETRNSHSWQKKERRNHTNSEEHEEEEGGCLMNRGFVSCFIMKGLLKG